MAGNYQPHRDSVGTILHSMLSHLGASEARGCGCGSIVAQMDNWTIQQNKENAEVTAERLQKQLAKVSRFKIAEIAWKSLTTGTAFQVDLLHPFLSLVHLAIFKAEQRAAQNKKEKTE